MPILRKKVNQASLNAHKARKKSKSRFIGEGKAMLDVAGEKRVYEARKKMSEAMKKRKTGIKGLIRTKTNPKAMNRLKKIREAQKTSKTKSNKILVANLGRNLTKTHPLLKGVFTNDLILTKSKRGNIRTGRVLDANKEIMLIDLNGKKTVLNLDKLAEIKRVK